MRVLVLGLGVQWGGVGGLYLGCLPDLTVQKSEREVRERKGVVKVGKVQKHVGYKESTRRDGDKSIGWSG